MRKTILITTSSFDLDGSDSIETLRKQGWTFVLNPFKRKLTADEVSELLATHKPLGMIAGVEPLGREQILSAPDIKVISRCGTGLDTVDLSAAKELGVLVTNTPDAPSPSVAELALGLMLSCLRQIPQADREIREGKWRAIKGNLLSGKTVGIVGFGRIGKRLAQLLSGFGVRLVAYDPILKGSGGVSDVEFVDLPQLLARADVVSLHLPYGKNTHHMLDANHIALIKKGAVLINVARGGLVDEVALYDALVSGHLFSAGFDVFETEPYTGVLSTLPNMVMTCHMGSSAQETRKIMEEEAAANLVNGLKSTGQL
jgi:D-3-phosphoglycerate dehydrogenase